MFKKTKKHSTLNYGEHGYSPGPSCIKQLEIKRVFLLQQFPLFLRISSCSLCVS